MSWETRAAHLNRMLDRIEAPRESLRLRGH